MHSYNKQSGFTIFELVIVIAISGIIAGLSTVIIGGYLDSYVALERREKLQTSIRLAVERISRELRHALPYSVCVYDGAECSNNAQNKFYFIPVKDSGRYQADNGSYPGGPGRNKLPISPKTEALFDAVSTDNTNRINAVATDWVVVYNLDNVEIYNNANNSRRQLSSIIQYDIDSSGAIKYIDQIQFSAAVSFANESPVKRFHIIADNTVTLFYLDNGNLYRDTTTFSAPYTPSGNQRLLMQNVKACTFTYSSGSLKRSGLLRIDITIEIDNERIQVVHNAHVYNTP